MSIPEDCSIHCLYTSTFVIYFFFTFLRKQNYFFYIRICSDCLHRLSFGLRVKPLHLSVLPFPLFRLSSFHLPIKEAELASSAIICFSSSFSSSFYT